MTLIERLRSTRNALYSAEAAHPNSPPLAELHRQALHLVIAARDARIITADEAAELAAPQGGGTPKTPAE